MQSLFYLMILDPPLKIEQNRPNISLWRAGQVGGQIYPYVFGLIIAAFIQLSMSHLAYTAQVLPLH